MSLPDSISAPASEAVAWGRICCAFVALVVAMPLVTMAPSQGKPVAVVFPPWTTDQAAFDRVLTSGGRPLDFASVPGTIIAIGEGEDFFKQLRLNGATILLDASLAASLCAAPTSWTT